MSFVSSPPPRPLTEEPLSGHEAEAAPRAGDLHALWPDDADLWPRAVRLSLIGVLSLASWGLLLGVAYGLRSTLG